MAGIRGFSDHHRLPPAILELPDGDPAAIQKIAAVLQRPLQDVLDADGSLNLAAEFDKQSMRFLSIMMD